MLVRLMEGFETLPRPFVMKCSGGHDRTALAAALFVVHDGGWEALDAARAQFDAKKFGHKPKRYQFWLKPFLDFAAEAAGGKDLAAWVRSGYSPEALAAWLTARGLADSHKGIFEKPSRSPFQL